jgi:hypothetical protein
MVAVRCVGVDGPIWARCGVTTVAGDLGGGWPLDIGEKTKRGD